MCMALSTLHPGTYFYVSEPWLGGLNPQMDSDSCPEKLQKRHSWRHLRPGHMGPWLALSDNLVCGRGLELDDPWGPLLPKPFYDCMNLCWEPAALDTLELNKTMCAFLYKKCSCSPHALERKHEVLQLNQVMRDLILSGHMQGILVSKIFYQSLQKSYCEEGYGEISPSFPQSFS